MQYLRAIQASDGIEKLGYVYFGSHQWHEEVLSLKGVVKHVGFPGAVITSVGAESLRRAEITLTKTVAVPNIVPSKEVLKASWDNWDETYWGDRPAINQNYIIAYMPGDADLVDGSKQLFTKESAVQFCDAIKKIYEMCGGKHVLLHNGPRTGKYNENGEVICTHTHDRSEPAFHAWDAITRKIRHLLNERGVPHTIYNFAWVQEGDKKTARSLQNPLTYLGSVNKNNVVILSGESVSNISYMPYFGMPRKCFVFSPSSMTAEHSRVVETIYNAGHASIVNAQAVVYCSENRKMEQQDLDAPKVANALTQGMQEASREKGAVYVRHY